MVLFPLLAASIGDCVSVYNGMQNINTIPENCDYFLFRQGVKPMWEDSANKGGCELRISILRNMNAANMWKTSVSDSRPVESVLMMRG